MAKTRKASSGKASSSKASSARGSSKKSTSASRGTSKRSSSRRSSSKRELIDTGTDKRYVRRSAGGQFKESDDMGRSLSADRRRKAKTRSKAGQGDRGDRAR